MIPQQATIEDLEKLCSTKDLSEHFGIPVETIAAAARRGGIPGCIMVLGQYYFDKEKASKEWIPGAVALQAKELGPPVHKGFAKGNPFGGAHPRAGRPKRAVEARYLKALSEAISMEDWLAIIQKAVEQARTGERHARAWLSNYLMGTPIQRIAAEVDIVNRRDFSAADRAAAVMALLDEARKREDANIVDVIPNEKQD